MKKTRIFLCIAAVALLSSACKPIYEKQIEGQWVVDRYYLNGNDLTALQQFHSFIFSDGGALTETYIISSTGTWAIQRKEGGDLGQYQLILTIGGNVRAFDIKEISKDTLDIYRATDSGSEEYILERPATPET
jgi:hypothetical protein